MNSVAVSPDGTTLASGSSDETVILWDISNEQVKQIGWPITGYKGAVNSVVFSPVKDMELVLAVADQGGSIWLKHVGLAAWRNQACSIANQNLPPELEKYFGGIEHKESCPKRY